jgi:hypothetical protein
MPAHNWSDPAVINNINLKAQVPAAGPVPVSPGDPVYSIYQLQNTTDWVTNPGTALSFGSILIGKSGGIDATKVLIPAVQGIFSAAPGLGAGGRFATGLTVIGKEGISLKQIQATAAAPLRTAIGSTNLNRRTS